MLFIVDLEGPGLSGVIAILAISGTLKRIQGR